MREICEQMTGCRGAGDYDRWAKGQGYPHCEVVDWTSSAGNWSFIVSRDGVLWFLMFQTNNYPNAGFARTVDEERSYEGTAEEVLAMLAEEMEC